MSFSTEQFVSKLNTLEDSQESIASASKWLLSQHREALKIAETWKEYMIESGINTRRKLLGIYLVNHVVQEAKRKKINQFQSAFGDAAVVVFEKTFRTLPSDLRKKVKRVFDIWKDRNIFSKDVLFKIQDTMKSSSSSLSSSSSGSSSIPTNLKELTKKQTEIIKIAQSLYASKLRFTEAASSLDPSSVVYAENYKTVVRIGQAAKDVATQSIDIRKSTIEILNNLLKEEKKSLEQDENSFGEIEMTLASKDPLNMNNSDADEDILPTYEASEDEKSSDEDNDEERDTLQNRNKEQEPVNNETQIDNNILKRSLATSEISQRDDGSSIKKLTTASDKVSFKEQEEEYDPFSASGNTESTNNEVGASNAVTSSIQDLLSKLAN